MEIVTRSALCICMFVLVSVEMPAAQTSRVRLDLARENRPVTSHGDALSLLRSGDRILRDIDRNRRSRANREAFEAELDRRLAAGARGRLTADNARLEEEIERLRREIAMTRRGPSLFRVVFSLGVRIFVTALTGNPIAGAAVSGAVSGLMDGGGIENVLASAALSAGTTFVGDKIAVAVAGGDWDAAGTLEQVLGAGAAGGATGAGVAIVRGESAEDVVKAAAVNMGIAVAAEVITGAILDESSGEDVTDDGTVLVTRTRSAEEMLADLGIEMGEPQVLAAVVRGLEPEAGNPMAAGYKVLRELVRKCRKSKKCRDEVDRIVGDVMYETTTELALGEVKSWRRNLNRSDPEVYHTFSEWICAWGGAGGEFQACPGLSGDPGRAPWW